MWLLGSFHSDIFGQNQSDPTFRLGILAENGDLFMSSSKDQKLGMNRG